MATRAPHTTKPSRGASAQQWIEGARLRTLPLAVAPVAIGSGAAATMHGFNAPLALLCLVVALALQVGVNYSNDYSDGVRGTDDFRVGPPRLTGSGAANPKRVLAVALAFFAVAGLAGLIIVLVTAQWWMIAVGAAAIIAAWFYTGGKNPYGYAGWGEVFVFIFFGLVATLGTTYVQAGFVNDQAWLGAVGTGFISCAVLVVNNIRDIGTDTQAGKKTLSVRIGKTASIVLFGILLLVPFGIAALIAVFYPVAWLVQLGLLLALPACLIAATGKTPKEYVLALKLSSFAGLVFGLGIAVAYFYAS
jgi:1,4-dihydroxy-2-naphthoate octaprenyltransferase